MYKLLLCWRYLLTRYLALACIVSVMLGVATLIVVNSVMGGFSTKLKNRLHGLLSDMVVESGSMNGFPDPEGKIRQIRQSPIGDKIQAMTPTLETFAILQFPFRGEMVTKHVKLIGIDPEGRSRVGGFAEYLLSQKKNTSSIFELSADAKQRHEEHERERKLLTMLPLVEESEPRDNSPAGPPPPDSPPLLEKTPEGIIVGYAIGKFKYRNPQKAGPLEEASILDAGDDVIITTVSGQKLAPVFDRFTVCDFFKSEMSEYDSNYVFVPLGYLQNLLTMQNRVSSIEIKLKDEVHDAKFVEDTLKSIFSPDGLRVATWEEKQGPLLAAIGIERGLLNVLLFLIIGVAGFGILAIFAMMVVEKTRDIGILKALGASNGGVMKIFLGYGLLLGIVGAGLGTALGLTLTIYINEIEMKLSQYTGQDLFPRDVYYFDKIPTDIQTWSIVLINFGAVAIAVLASVLPSLRAALLHPVRALRYE